MKKHKMKKLFFTVLTVLSVSAFLCGCSYSDYDKQTYEKWDLMVSSLKRNVNYSVSEISTVTQEGKSDPETTKTQYKFTGNMTEMDEAGKSTFMLSAGGQCVACIPDESGEYQYMPTDYSEKYFYAYNAMRRLQKVEGFIDEGKLIYDERTGKFTGTDFNGTYEYNGIVRKPLEITVALNGSSIAYFIEKSEYFDEETGVKYFRTDEMRFFDFGSSAVMLPKEVISFLTDYAKENSIEIDF